MKPYTSDERRKIILNSLRNPEQCGNLRSHLLLNGWKWSHVEEVLNANYNVYMCVSSYFLEAIRWEFRD